MLTFIQKTILSVIGFADIFTELAFVSLGKKAVARNHCAKNVFGSLERIRCYNSVAINRISCHFPPGVERCRLHKRIFKRREH